MYIWIIRLDISIIFTLFYRRYGEVVKGEFISQIFMKTNNTIVTLKVKNATLPYLP